MPALISHRLRERFGDSVLDIPRDQPAPGNDTAVVAAEALLAIATFLRDEPSLAFDMPIDCTAVDWQDKKQPRFCVVYHLYSLKHGHRLRLTVPVGTKANDEQDPPTCPSLTPLWPGLNWHERECFDMYGIRFTGHPDLRRVLMYDEFVGYPLRKDYPIDREQPLVELRDVAAVPTERNAPPEMLNEP
jgi:NADH-quinone oxidoreductase subunit C